MTTSITTSAGTLRPLLVLALPVLVEQFLNVLVGLVDTWLTGNFLPGECYLAAIGLLAYVLWLLPSMFSAVAIGATALVARFVGAGDRRLAARVTNQALLIGSLVAVVAAALTALCGPWFISAMQLREDAALLAEQYLWFLVPVIPAMMVEQVGIACLRGAGDTVSGLVTMTIVNLVNVLLSSCLVIGIAPFPELGWRGLAIGTACGHVVGALLILGMLIRGRAGLRLRLHLLHPDGDLIRRLLRVGIPGGADMMSVVFCHLWFVGIINSLGTVAAAAHGLGVRIESLAYLPGAAFQVAASTMTGQYLGAGDARRARRSALLAVLAGGGVMLAAGGVFFFGAGGLVTFFTGSRDNPVAELTVPLMQLVAFAMPSLALTMILSGALRGAGDTRWPLVFTFLGFLGVRIPGACLLAWQVVPLPWSDVVLPGAGLGVWGAWCAMLVDVVLRSVLVVWRFWHGGWERVEYCSSSGVAWLSRAE